MLSSNITSIDDVIEHRDKYTIIVVSIAGVIITIIAAVGNLGVIAAIVIDEYLSSQMSSYLVINLSFVDFITPVLTIIPTVIAIIQDEWTLGVVVCYVQSAAYFSFTAISLQTLGFISLDRGIAILKALHYPQIVTKTRVFIVIAYIWVAGLFTGLFPIYKGWVYYDYYEAMCTVDKRKPEDLIPFLYYLAPVVLFDLLTPSFFIFYFNAKIISTIRKSRKNAVVPVKSIQNSNMESSKQNQNSESSSDIKVVASILVVTLIFFICVTPFAFTRIMKVTISMELPPRYVLFGIMFQFLSVSINPFIYAILRKDFQRAFKKLARLIFHR